MAKVSTVPLIISPFPSRSLSISLANNPFTQPLRRKTPIQRIQIPNDILAALDNGVLGCNRAVGRDAKLKGREERVRHLVRRKGDVGIFKEALREEVRECVVLLVEGEYGGVGDAYVAWGVSKI